VRLDSDMSSPSRLPSRPWLLGTQLALCVALTASAMLYVHYLAPADSDFCGLRSGCEELRRSDLSRSFGRGAFSLPLWALLILLGVLGLSLRRGKDRSAALARGGVGALWARPELTLFAACGLGGVVGLGLGTYQVVLGSYCWLCLVVDGSLWLAALLALLHARSQHAQPSLPESALTVGGWCAIALVLVGAPLLWGQVRAPVSIPAEIAALYQPGKINVVEFVDFQCPHCRRLHATLQPLLVEYGERVAFQRLQRPLDQHQYADPAARAALCAEAQGRGEPMADRLFSVELDDGAIRASAEALQLDLAGFYGCLNSAETDAALQRHAALLPEERFNGLPTTYIGPREIIGGRTETQLRDALEYAARPPRWTVPGPAYLALVALLLAAIVALSRRPRGAAAD
jgi:predicted DsbA family dithiol-disulfide isomerase